MHTSTPSPAPLSNENTEEANLPLDWTRLNTANNCSPSNPTKRYPQDVVPPDTFSPTQTTYIEIVGTAGQKITDIGESFHALVNAQETTHFILRSHLIHNMRGIRHFSNLELLELYDNQIEVLEELGPIEKQEEEEGEENIKLGNSTTVSTLHWPGQSIHTLDLSYNAIRSMEPVQFCVNLQVLYLANNKIKEMAGLKSLSQLRILDLGANRIRVMDPDQLSGLGQLTSLWLGKNKITDITGLDTLTQLRQLDIQCNRLTRVEQLHGPSLSLEELYLADNGIDDVGFEMGFIHLSFPKLTTLDVSRNQLTTLSSMTHLTSLTDLWLSGNQISSFDNVDPIRVLDSSLESIYLEYNPIYQDFEYRKKLKELLPSLEQIDAVRIDGGYGMTWNVTNVITSTRDSILKPTSMGGMKQLQDKIMKRAEEETDQKKKQEGEERVV